MATPVENFLYAAAAAADCTLLTGSLKFTFLTALHSHLPLTSTAIQCIAPVDDEAESFRLPRIIPVPSASPLVRATSTTDATDAASCKWSTAAAAAALPLQWSTVSRKRENSGATSEAGSCRKIGVLGQQTDNDIGSN